MIYIRRLSDHVQVSVAGILSKYRRGFQQGCNDDCTVLQQWYEDCPCVNIGPLIVSL